MMQNLISQHLYLMYLSVALISLAVGSLLNVIIYRLPIMLQMEWHQEYLSGTNKTKPINLFLPRSFCPMCKSMIKAWHNIPIFSYLFLQGCCSQCKRPISIRYPLIELSTLILSLYASWHFGFSLKLPFALIAIWILIALIFIDLDHQILPDSLSLGLLWVGLIANTQALFAPLAQGVFSAVIGYMSLWVFIQIFYLVTGKIGMGHGDFKLFAAFGAWFGWLALPVILLLSSMAGSIIGLLYLYVKGLPKGSKIPFGPFLSVSGLIYLFWGPAILHYYL